MSGRRGFWLASLLVIIATVARIGLVHSLDDQGYFGKYLILAAEWNAGEVPAGRFSDLSVAYLILIRWMSLFLEPVAIRAIQIVLTSVAALACGLAAWKIAGRLAGVLAATFLLFSRSVLLNATEIEPETFILLAVSLFLFAIASIGRERKWPAAAAGVAAGLAIILRPVFVLPFVLVLCALAIRPRREGESRLHALAHPLAMLGLAAIPVLGVQIHQAASGSKAPPMNPGTVFFEGMNPYATGLSGIAPRIVNELERSIARPDSLHIAYRLVADRASEEEEGGSNAYWFTKARHFMADHPVAALELTVRKLIFTAHAHDAWDLVTIWRKERELRGWPWVPFSLLVPLAIIGAVSRLRDPAVRLITLVCIGQTLVMMIFYVTARQRNALWPGVVILAAIAIPWLARLWSRRRWLSTSLVALVLIAAILLTLDWSPVQEDDYSWHAAERSARLREEATSSGEERASRLYALDRTWLDAGDPAGQVPDELIEEAVGRQLASVSASPRAFDLARALLEIGDGAKASAILETLQGYSPERGNLIPKSLHYQLARASLARKDHAAAIEHLERAAVEAPGTPEIEALTMVLEGREPGEVTARLLRYSDSFTARRVVAGALEDAGRHEEARRLLDTLTPQ